MRTNRRTGETVSIIDMSQVYRIHFSELVMIDEIVNNLEALDNVDYAEGPFYAWSFATEPNDPWYVAGNHWNLDSISAKYAWDFTLGSPSITISINDFYNPNVTTLHEDLVDKVDYHFYNYFGGHATMVASVAGATTNNNLGIASLGWNLRLRLDRNYVQGIQDAIDGGADVINFSWLGGNPLLKNEIHNALLQGVVCVAGAGNDNYTRPYVAYPAAYNFGDDGQVIAVTATWLDFRDNYRKHWYYWYNYSPGTDPILVPTNAFIDVSAPAVDVPVASGLWSNFYHLDSGTSFASPLVAALAGLILSIDSTFTPAYIYDIIKSTTDKITPNNSYYYNYDENGWTAYVGYGRINAYNALNVASGAPHRPRHLVVTANAQDEAQLDWTNSYYTEVSQYKIYRAHTAGEPPVNWSLVATIDAWEGFPNPSPVLSWTDVDTTVGSGPHKLWYYIVAVNNDSLASLPSNTDWIAWNKYGKKSGDVDYTKENSYSLEQNYPNPFNPVTQIKYSLREKGFVSLKVFDILGNEVITVVNETQQKGHYKVIIDGSRLVSGIYFYTLRVNEYSKTNKMILLK